MKTSCKGIIGALMGHAFVPRYSLGMPTITSITGGSAGDTVRVVDASKPRTYVADVCTRCGLKINSLTPPQG